MEKKNSQDLAGVEFQFKFESHGASFLVSSNDESYLGKIRSELPALLPASLNFNDALETRHHFQIKVNGDYNFELYKDGEFITYGEVEKTFFDYSMGRLRLWVAEFSEENVFIHAGVVGWKEKAIIIPGNSFQGKTTLTAALVKKGALYFSDEYAVLDENSMVYPFPKTLSLRGVIDPYSQLETPIEEIGGRVAAEPLRPGLVLITEFEEGAPWLPEILSAGNGIMAILPHTITINHKPRLSLEVLKKLTTDALIVKSKRGEADEFAEQFLDFCENIWR